MTQCREPRPVRSLCAAWATDSMSGSLVDVIGSDKSFEKTNWTHDIVSFVKLLSEL
jgi:hypothetical protein